MRAAWSRTSSRGHFGSSGPFFRVGATFALCLTFFLAPRGKLMLALISDSLVHCCAPWLFRLLSCLPGEGRMPPQNHSSQQPTRHDGEPWVTPTVQPHRPSADPMHLPTVTPGLVLGPPPAPGVIAVDINSDSDIDVRSDRSDRVKLPASPVEVAISRWQGSGSSSCR